MRFGVCAPVQHLPVLIEAGYDYVEPPLSLTLRPEEAEADVMPRLHEFLAETPLRPETWNLFLPGDLKVVGEHTDRGRQGRYLQAAFARAAALGGQIVVFGSGGARGIPSGFSDTSAHQQLGEFLERAGGAAAQYGITVVVEPLNKGECNMINSVGEALALAHRVGSESVGVLSDLYHIAVEGQSYEETRLAGPLLKHVHVAGAEGRRAPIRADVPFLTAYFRALRAGGYTGRISVEGQWDDLPAQAGETLALLREAWAEAGPPAASPA